MGAFDSLEKNIKEDENKVSSFVEDKFKKTDFKPDWEKISKLVLTILKPELPVTTYNILTIATASFLKKRSLFNKIISCIVFTSIPVAGIYEIIHLILTVKF